MIRVQGSATKIGPKPALLGSHPVTNKTGAVLVSVGWDSFGHGDVVFTIAGNWNPVNGNLHPHRFDAIITLKQALGEDNTPIQPLEIPNGATVQFLASAASGADSAEFVAEVSPNPV